MTDNKDIQRSFIYGAAFSSLVGMMIVYIALNNNNLSNNIIYLCLSSIVCFGIIINIIHWWEN